MDWLERRETLESRRDGVVNYDGRLDERRSGKHLYVLRVLTAGTPRHRDEQDARISHVQVTIKTWIFGSRGCLLTMILRFWMTSRVTDKFLRIGLFNDTNEVERDCSFSGMWTTVLTSSLRVQYLILKLKFELDSSIGWYSKLEIQYHSNL